jgi:hypothetical protein
VDDLPKGTDVFEFVSRYHSFNPLDRTFKKELSEMVKIFTIPFNAARN